MHRFAIYFAPARDSVLWRAGTNWLGRDPESGEVLTAPALEGYTRAAVQELAATARHYGFHATVKAPFRLPQGETAANLLDSLQDFCRARVPFPMPALDVGTLGDFVVLRPRRACDALTRLAKACVTDLDCFRAPAPDEELHRRRAAVLSARQAHYLERYGYPYVCEEFRFHMTLTDTLHDAERARLLPTLRDYFQDALREPLVMRELALFGQVTHDAAFRLLRRVPFGRTPPAHL